jgi:succinyl-CoA synthetase alpha subunit
LSFWDVYEMFLGDPETDAVVLVGEIGGVKEEEFAKLYAERGGGKPVVAYVAGRCAPRAGGWGTRGPWPSGPRGPTRAR